MGMDHGRRLRTHRASAQVAAAERTRPHRRPLLVAVAATATAGGDGHGTMCSPRTRRPVRSPTHLAWR